MPVENNARNRLSHNDLGSPEPSDPMAMAVGDYPQHVATSAIEFHWVGRNAIPNLWRDNRLDPSGRDRVLTEKRRRRDEQARRRGRQPAPQPRDAKPLVAVGVKCPNARSGWMQLLARQRHTRRTPARAARPREAGVSPTACVVRIDPQRVGSRYRFRWGRLPAGC